MSDLEKKIIEAKELGINFRLDQNCSFKALIVTTNLTNAEFVSKV